MCLGIGGEKKDPTSEQNVKLGKILLFTLFLPMNRIGHLKPDAELKLIMSNQIGRQTDSCLIIDVKVKLLTWIPHFRLKDKIILHFRLVITI